MTIQLYNSLTKKKEEFKPINAPRVGMYTCGPTVYNKVSIGNWRTYIMSDILHRILILNNYEVDFVMNITDVGHLTGDNEGDASSGQDRMEKASEREGKTAWEIALHYGSLFQKEYELLNLLPPRVFAKATEHIEEQIELIKKIEKAGFAYTITDGLYFDVDAYEKAGHTYGALSSLEMIKEGARVSKNPEKKDPRDFALWKFNTTGGVRDMEWESPWGKGFPGWHIECSAMSAKYLGAQFDIHVGGEDLRSTHHPNEIAQSEAACGCSPFVRYWVHGAFLLVDGGRMGKSLGNAYTLDDILEKDFNPLALRYLFLGGHYRKQQNFTWESLEAAENALHNMYYKFNSFGRTIGIADARYTEKFIGFVNDDMSTPQALALVWDVIKDENLTPADKKATLLFFDTVFGFNLTDLKEKDSTPIPEEIMNLVENREKARKEKNWEEADKLRDLIQEKGFAIKDTDDGTSVSQ